VRLCSGRRAQCSAQGYLLKKSSGIRKEWKRRFFVLDSLGMLYYFSNKARGRVCFMLYC
jgi:Arf-GAP/coiled-coil/ANK repeat/PH domain-containing protein